MAHTPKEMREHKKVLESRFLDMAKNEMDELLMTPDERKKLAQDVVAASEKLIKTPDKTQLTIAFNEQAKREINTLQRIVKRFHERIAGDPPPAKKPPSASASTDKRPATPTGKR